MPGTAVSHAWRRGVSCLSLGSEDDPAAAPSGNLTLQQRLDCQLRHPRNLNLDTADCDPFLDLQLMLRDFGHEQSLILRVSLQSVAAELGNAKQRSRPTFADV